MPGAPSYALGMARARLRLIRDPDTDEPYFFMGLCAPHAAFTLLGGYLFNEGAADNDAIEDFSEFLKRMIKVPIHVARYSDLESTWALP